MHQLMPKAQHKLDPDDCHALAAYWEAQASRNDANDETILVALAEAKHWRDVADQLHELTLATPYPATNI